MIRKSSQKTQKRQDDEIQKLTDLDLLEARAIRKRVLALGGFEFYVRTFWEYIDPAPLVWGPHLDIMCLALEAWSRKLINFLLINIPPGMAKSTLCVLVQTYCWALDPSWQYLSGSHDEDLSLRDAVKCRELIKHEKWQQVFQPGWEFNPSQDTKHLYMNTAGGARFSTSVGGSMTGFRGSAFVVDDPIDVNKAVSDQTLATATKWMKSLFSRVNGLADAQILLIMQRVCEGDPTDFILDPKNHVEGMPKWIHLRLASEYAPEEKCAIPELSWEDWRTEPGEPLFPYLQPAPVLNQLRLFMGDTEFEAQFNQRILKSSGGYAKWEHIRWFDTDTQVIASRCIEVFAVADLTFMKTEAKQEKVNEKRSYNCVWIMGYDGSFIYLLDEARGRWDWDTGKEAIKGLLTRWYIYCFAYESAAVADVVAQEIEDIVGMVEPIKPIGSKLARFQVAARYLRLGRFWAPDLPWAKDAMSEVIGFPNRKEKDRADVFAHGVIRVTSETGESPHHPYQEAY